MDECRDGSAKEQWHLPSPLLREVLNKETMVSDICSYTLYHEARQFSFFTYVPDAFQAAMSVLELRVIEFNRKQGCVWAF